MNTKILILTSESKTNHYLVQELSAHFDISCVIYEKGSFAAKFRMIRYRLKKQGLLKTLGQVVFIIYAKIIINSFSKQKINHLLGSVNKTNRPSIKLKNLNCSKVAELIKKYNPNVVVVSGTSIIKKNIINLCNSIINIHCGITPEYRGVHGAFWAIYNQDYKKAGVTIHQIDAGVDTGPILYQKRIEFDPATDTFCTLAIKQYLVGTDLMIKSIKEIISSKGNIKTFSKSSTLSKQWYHPTITEYIKFKKIIKNLRKKQL